MNLQPSGGSMAGLGGVGGGVGGRSPTHKKTKRWRVGHVLSGVVGYSSIRYHNSHRLTHACQLPSKVIYR